MLFDKQGSTANSKWKLIGLGGKLLIDGLFAGSKIHLQGCKAIEDLLETRRYILAFWHSRILLVSYAHKGSKGTILVSNSADGEIIARILQLQGHTTVRGSTGKGGMRALTRIAQEIVSKSCPGGIVPDGPQGPRHKVQPGVILLARKSGFPIVPISYAAKFRWQFGSWDRFVLPLPFSPCCLVYGTPIVVPKKTEAQAIQTYQIALEQELNRITAEADDFFGHRFTP